MNVSPKVAAHVSQNMRLKCSTTESCVSYLYEADVGRSLSESNHLMYGSSTDTSISSCFCSLIIDLHCHSL